MSEIDGKTAERLVRARYPEATARQCVSWNMWHIYRDDKDHDGLSISACVANNLSTAAKAWIDAELRTRPAEPEGKTGEAATVMDYPAAWRFVVLCDCKLINEEYVRRKAGEAADWREIARGLANAIREHVSTCEPECRNAKPLIEALYPYDKEAAGDE